MANSFIDSSNSNEDIFPRDWRDIVQGDEVALNNVPHIEANRYSNVGDDTTSSFKNYFNNEDAVAWQLRHVRSCGRVHN